MCASLQETESFSNMIKNVLRFFFVVVVVCFRFSLGCSMPRFFSGPRERYSYLHHSAGQSVYIRRSASFFSLSFSSLVYPHTLHVHVTSLPHAVAVPFHDRLHVSVLHAIDDVSSVLHLTSDLSVNPLSRLGSMSADAVMGSVSWTTSSLINNAGA